VGSRPGKQIADWLTAGVVEQGLFTPTEEGTPQGGVVSPLLLNVALHGMEHAAGARYRVVGNDGAASVPGSPVLIRYADDFVALCRTRDEAMQVKARLAAWLTPRGLAFNEDKTRVADLDEGYDFLGFNVRRYRGLLLIKPSKTAVRRIRKRLRTEVRALRGSNAAAVIARLNPIIRGWAAYYRSVVASEVFTSLDHYTWKLVYKWARHTHPNKPTSWVVARYFGMFNKSRRNKWVFGDRDSGALPAGIRLDQDRAAPAGSRHRVARRRGPGGLLEHPTASFEDATPGRPHHPAAARQPAGRVHLLRATPPARRPSATNPARMGTVVRPPAQSDGPQRHQPTTGRQPQRSATLSAPHPLPPPGNRQKAGQHSAHQHAIGLA
jgi:group II intron maturase/reverse transcriptase-like protein